MRADELRQLLRKEPFIAFTVFVTDGRNFIIRHPEFVALLPSSFQIGVPATELPIPVPERKIVLSLLHFTGYEQVQPAVSTTSN
ncbi:MAG: hypothetical protein ACJ8FY_23500 [Gemmataceae bacterium]